MDQPSLLVPCVRCGRLVPPGTRGRERRYCSPECSRAEWRQRERSGQYGQCLEPDCEKGVRAKGLCSTHYNQLHQPGRHRKVTVACTWCGTPSEKEASRTNRYQGVFCSLGCRDTWRTAIWEWPAVPEWRACPCGVKWYKSGRDAIYCFECVDAGRHIEDLRSPIRRAIEDGVRSPIVLDAIRERCDLGPSGCWIWRTLDSTGYPIFQWDAGGKARRVAVHRLSLEMKLGASLGSQQAHHICANPQCVNPEHLQPVTAAANMAEMHARNYLVRRIRELEEALSAARADHPLLAQVGISLMREVA